MPFYITSLFPTCFFHVIRLRVFSSIYFVIYSYLYHIETDFNSSGMEPKFLIWILFSVVFLIEFIVGPPVLQSNDVDGDVNGAKHNETNWDINLEYERYLQEVIKILEDDPEFKHKLENAHMDLITSGNISSELQFVNHRIRSRLDEVKRVEMIRLRKAMKEQAEMASNGLYSDDENEPLEIRRKKFQLPLHLDASNPNTFEIEDLKKLVVQTTIDLAEVDKKRREEFKTYEMEKEHEYRESLKNMDEEHRKQAEEQHNEQVNKHKDHPKVHHPGSKQQIEEVWEKQDQLPVEDFDPRTFHQIHDLNGDGFWDNDEINALFSQELEKMYEQGNSEDDMKEKYEEMNRMREHVVNETDTNKDTLISVAEFIEMTRRRDFEEDPGWQGIEEQELFDEQEFQQYEHRRMQGMVPPGAHMPIYIPEGMPGSQYQHMPPPGVHPQMPVYQQPPPNMGYQPQVQQQYPGGNQGYNPQQQFQGGNQGYNPEQQFQRGNQGYNPQQQQQYHPGNEGYHPQQFQTGNIQPNPNYQQQQQYQIRQQVPQQQVPVATGQQQQVPVATGQQQVPVATGQQQQVPVATGQQQVPVATGQQQQVPVATGQQQQVPVATGQQQQAVNPSNIDPSHQQLPSHHQEPQPNLPPQASNVNPSQPPPQGENVNNPPAVGGVRVPDPAANSIPSKPANA